MKPETRPDPEALLKKIQENESKDSKGFLKIFLGAAAGVGKTYAMLRAASSLKADGEDVVIGYVETHGRLETESILPKDIEYIPLKQIEYKNTMFREFDIDRALERHPDYIILDELAHTNAVGSRNVKRYQDVLELLNAGINVFAALNVQHIESLNDIVEQITEIKINETVPDQIIELADEIVLIDLPPEDLITRLSEGKIYPKERIDSALNNFFRKGNLTALRELSLRKTAQKVDKQVLEYRTQEAIESVWASNDKLLLVLKPGQSSEKLVRSGKNLYDKGFSQWFVGYIENPRFEFSSINEKQKIVGLIDLARQLGARVVKLAGVDPAVAIANCVKENNINTVMLSQHQQTFFNKYFNRNMAHRLGELIPGVNLHLINDETEVDVRNRQAKRKLNYAKLSYKIFFFFTVFAILGSVLHFVNKWVSNENILMLYLLVMVVANKGRGKISAIIAAFMGTLSYDFFIIPPYFSLVIEDHQYILTFLFLAIIGITFSIINGNLRFQVNQLSRTKQQNELFNEVNRKFAEAMQVTQVIEMIPDFFRQLFHSKFMLLLPNLEEKLELKAGTVLSHFDDSIALWVFNNNQGAGLNTDTFSGNNLFYVPVLSKMRSRGVLVVEPSNEVEFFLTDVQILLHNFLELLATTLERIHCFNIAMQTQVELTKMGIENKSEH